jgi:hypothetical protein
VDCDINPIYDGVATMDFPDQARGVVRAAPLPTAALSWFTETGRVRRDTGEPRHPVRMVPAGPVGTIRVLGPALPDMVGI